MNIAEKTAQKNAELIYEHFLNLDDGEGFSLPKMWGLKQKICSKTSDVPTAMKDKAGNLISNKNCLKNVCKETYMERLSHKSARSSEPE